jgi:hypothetical protein
MSVPQVLAVQPAGTGCEVSGESLPPPPQPASNRNKQASAAEKRVREIMDATSLVETCGN